MIHYKSKSEIAKIREAGDILARCHQMLKRELKAGMTTLQLDALADEFIADHDSIPSFKGYNGFPAALCISVNEEVVHGIPGKRVIKEGDLVSIDCGVTWQGYIADCAWTYYVGEISSDLEKLMKVTEESLYAGIEQARPGNYVGDISKAIEGHVKPHGYGIVEELVGHGVGKFLHEEPNIPNFDSGRKGARLREGMVIAIEPMINLGTRRVKVLSDDWTIVTIDSKPSVHFEHTVAITESGPEILSRVKGVDE